MNTQFDLSYAPDTRFGLGNCGVVALSVATGINYENVHSAIQTRFNKRSTWTGGTTFDQRLVFLKEHDVSHEVVRVGRMTLGSYLKKMPRDTVAIVTTTRHVQVCYNGMFCDQHTRGFVNGSSKRWQCRKLISKDIVVIHRQDAPSVAVAQTRQTDVDAPTPVQHTSKRVRCRSAYRGKPVGIKNYIQYHVLNNSWWTKEEIARDVRQKFPGSTCSATDVQIAVRALHRGGWLPSNHPMNIWDD